MIIYYVENTSFERMQYGEAIKTKYLPSENRKKPLRSVHYEQY